MTLINDEIKEKIKENIVWDVPTEDYEKTFARFDECYILREGPLEELVVKPYIDNPGITIKFSLETGELIGPEDWEYARQHGELIIW